MSGLPLEIRRDLNLLHTLDTRWVMAMTELRRAQDAYVRGLRSRAEKLPKDGSVDVRRATEDADALARIAALSAECQQMSDEKSSTARQAYDSLSTSLNRLDTYLHSFEEELRASGELNDDVRFVRYRACASPLSLPLTSATPSRAPPPSPFYPRRSSKSRRLTTATTRTSQRINHARRRLVAARRRARVWAARRVRARDSRGHAARRVATASLGWLREAALAMFRWGGAASLGATATGGAGARARTSRRTACASDHNSGRWWRATRTAARTASGST